MSENDFELLGMLVKNFQAETTLKISASAFIVRLIRLEAKKKFSIDPEQIDLFILEKKKKKNRANK